MFLPEIFKQAFVDELQKLSTNFSGSMALTDAQLRAAQNLYYKTGGTTPLPSIENTSFRQKIEAGAAARKEARKAPEVQQLTDYNKNKPDFVSKVDQLKQTAAIDEARLQKPITQSPSRNWIAVAASESNDAPGKFVAPKSPSILNTPATAMSAIKPASTPGILQKLKSLLRR
jgi:hypothetical protein